MREVKPIAFMSREAQEDRRRGVPLCACMAATSVSAADMDVDKDLAEAILEGGSAPSEATPLQMPSGMVLNARVCHEDAATPAQALPAAIICVLWAGAFSMWRCGGG